VIGLAVTQVISFAVVFAFAANFIYRRHMRSLLHTQETVLRQDLFVMREAIDQFTMDKNAAPQGLVDLQQAGYLIGIPKDPFTHSSDWATDTCDTLTGRDQTTTGICDVHSVASGSSPFEGTPYNSW
jgi:general secretion pathway protein G